MSSESVSIPKNPRTDRPVGYAFVDLSTPTEAERAISELSGKEILERKVSVQLARKPEPAGEKVEGANGEGAEGTRRKTSTRGRGRAGRGRGGATRGRGGRAGSGVSFRTRLAPPLGWTDDDQDGDNVEGTAAEGAAAADATVAPAATTEVQPLKDITNKNDKTDEKLKSTLPRPVREPRRERGPPADGIPSKTKVMVANLPYDLTEEKVRSDRSIRRGRWFIDACHS